MYGIFRDLIDVELDGGHMLCCIHFIFIFSLLLCHYIATILLFCRVLVVVVGQNFVILQLIIIYCSAYTIRYSYFVKVTTAAALAASESAKTKNTAVGGHDVVL